MKSLLKRIFSKIADYLMYQYLQYKLAQQLLIVTSAEIESLRSATIGLEKKRKQSGCTIIKSMVQ